MAEKIHTPNASQIDLIEEENLQYENQGSSSDLQKTVLSTPNASQSNGREMFEMLEKEKLDVIESCKQTYKQDRRKAKPSEEAMTEIREKNYGLTAVNATLPRDIESICVTDNGQTWVARQY